MKKNKEWNEEKVKLKSVFSLMFEYLNYNYTGKLYVHFFILFFLLINNLLSHFIIHWYVYLWV